jgi:hypothetical protein
VRYPIALLGGLWKRLFFSLVGFTSDVKGKVSLSQQRVEIYPLNNFSVELLKVVI